ncbi:tetratricopeptide repeat protein [Mesorhizobium sp. AaZ16]|uniref:tetratricopeptide repeat protein n=1 Tax=Mesorhizobium sp. AaZ16 TaxID=3402289 RepID=UPI00374EFBEB
METAAVRLFLLTIAGVIACATFSASAQESLRFSTSPKHSQSNYADNKAVAELEALAKGGNSHALLELAESYRKGGRGIEPDPVRARGYFDQAIAAGNVNAAQRLGSILVKGDGLAADPAAGLKLLEGAAEKDHLWALYDLGEIYRRGLGGLRPDPQKAESYLTRAKDAGNTSAGLVLAAAQLKGDGVVSNPHKAVAELEALAKGGNSHALLELAESYRKGGRGIEPDPVRARGYFDQAIAAGNVNAAQRLGSILVKGDGLAADPAAGLKLLEGAAEKDHLWALYDLGEIYRRGLGGLRPDPQKAESYLTRAKDAGNTSAGLVLAAAQLKGDGVVSDPHKAVAELEALAKGGNSHALLELAESYRKGGRGIEPDPVRARGYFDQAIAAGNVNAAQRLGSILVKGDGLAADPAAGLKLLEGAAEKDHLWALYDLGDLYARGYPPVRRNRPLGKKLLALAASRGLSQSYVRMAQAELRGEFGRISISRAMNFLKTAELAGNKHAVVARADAYLNPPRGAKANPQRAIRILRDAAGNGNEAAARSLIDVRRRGRGRMLKSNLNEARREFEKYRDILGASARHEEFLLKAASTRRQYAALSKEYFKFEDRERLMGDLFATNVNAALYIVQSKLRSKDMYKGRLNGVATSNSIRAILLACKGIKGSSSCGPYPISSKAFLLIDRYY